MNIDAAIALAMPLVFDAEGCRLTAWLDKLPTTPVWTIGHGTTRLGDKPVTAGQTCSQAEADDWALAVLRTTAQRVLKSVTVKIDECQLAALTSLAYNIGIGRFWNSTVLEALNLGRYDAAADRFRFYDHAGGKAIAGLTARRGRERQLFLTRMVSTKAQSVQPSADDLNQREIDNFDPPTAA
jgi:lysozyme